MVLQDSIEAATPAVGRVLAVDDHPEFLSVLRGVVAGASSLAVVGEARCGEEAVELARELQPHLVLMDVQMPGIGGIGATRAIKAAEASTVVVLVSMTPPHELQREAAECSADAVVWKRDLRPALLDEIWAHRRGRG